MSLELLKKIDFYFKNIPDGEKNQDDIIKTLINEKDYFIAKKKMDLNEKIKDLESKNQYLIKK